MAGEKTGPAQFSQAKTSWRSTTVAWIAYLVVLVLLCDLQTVCGDTTDAETEELRANTTRILSTLLDGYDKRIRPNFGGGPVAVEVSMYVYSMGPVTESKMEYTLDMYFRQQWHDERLTFDGVPYLALNAEILDSFWIPDIYFINEKSASYHTILYRNSLLRIDPRGNMLYSTRLTVTASCNMDLSHFPFDKQRCSLEMESYAYSMDHVSFRWIANGAVATDPKISLPQFTVLDSGTRSRIAQYYVGNYTIIIADFFLGRDITYYVIQTYIPSSMITCLSWLSFWINRNAVPARVALGITTVLTMTTLVGNAGNSLPKLSYVKAIDLFLGMCYMFVFAALLEYVLVVYYDQPRYRKARELQQEFKDGASKEKEAHTNDVAIDMVDAEEDGKSSRRSRPQTNGSTPGREPISQHISRRSATSGSTSAADGNHRDAYGTIEGKVSSEEPDCMEETICSATQSFREKMCVFGLNPYSIDRISRIMFPLIFSVLNLVYWLVYLVFNEITVEDLKAQAGY